MNWTTQAVSGRQRRAHEKQREDPDDVYINVLHREEERKKQGLPPRIGIVPYSAVADEEKRIVEEQERKQHRSKRSKATPKAKSASREKSHEQKTPKKPRHTSRTV